MRNPVTYRAERRNTWRVTRINGLMPWEWYNTAAPKYRLGTLAVAGHLTTRGRSKYMPRQGKREMARRSGGSAEMGTLTK